MKHAFLRLCGVFLVLMITAGLTACQPNSPTVAAPSDTTIQDTTPQPLIESTVQPDPFIQTMKQVLLSMDPLLYTAQQRYPVYQDTVLLSEIMVEDSIAISQPSFAVVDMDGDGCPEVVVQRGDYNGFVVLRYVDDTVYGYEVNYRALINLKTDGTYYMSSGSSNFSYGKMRFIGSFYDNNVMLQALGEATSATYSMCETPISKDTFDQLATTIDNRPDVKWYEYTEAMVLQTLSSELNTENSAASPERRSAEMQNYLDSLSNILDFNFYPGPAATASEFETSYESYYDAWNQALDDIYSLCLNELSEDCIVQLRVEQQHWLESLRSDANEMPVFLLADKIKMRTYQLISMYFGDHFYKCEIV